MTKPPVLSLTALPEKQRAQAQNRFAIIRPTLEDGVTQAQIARTHEIPASTIQRSVRRYRESGLVGLADRAERSDKGKLCRLPTEAIILIEGLALQTPRRTMSADFTDKEAVATIVRTARGNLRWIDRLMLQVVTREVVETARQSYHWARLNQNPMMRCLTSVRFLRSAQSPKWCTHVRLNRAKFAPAAIRRRSYGSCSHK